MTRRLARGAGRAALGIAILAVLVVVVLHTPPGRNILRTVVLAELRRGGLEARLDRVEVEPLALEARVFGLELARPGFPPFLRAERVTARLRPRALRGQISLRELAAQGVVVDLVRDTRGDWNLPESAEPAPPASSFDWRSLLQARIALNGVDVRVREGSELDVAANGLGLDWSGDGGRGTLSARDDVTWRTGTRQGRLALSPVTVAADPRTLTLVSPRIAAPEGDATFTVAVGLDAAQPSVTVDAAGRLHLRELLGPEAPSVEGDVSWKARARGALPSLALEVDLHGEGLAVATLRMEADGTVRVADHRVTLETRMKEGTLPLGGRLSGVLKAHWPLASPREVEATLATRVEPASAAKEDDLGWRGQADLRVSAGRYVLTLDHRIGAAAKVVGRAEGRADLAQPLRSPLGGSLQVEVAEPATLALFLAGQPSAAPRPWWSTLKGRLAGDLDLAGTVGEPTAQGRFSGAGLTSQGLPPLEADARLHVGWRQADLESLEVRGERATLQAEAMIPFDGRPLTGRARGRLEDLGTWATVLPSGWAPSGQLAFEATLSGALARPEFDATVEGSGVSLLGQPPLQRLEGRLRGSADTVLLERLSLQQAAGRLDASGRFDPSTRAFSLQATADAFAFAPLPPGTGTEQGVPLRGLLQGKAEWRVKDGEAEGSGRFELRDLTWDERSLGAGTLEVARDATRPHGFTAELRLDEADLRAFARAAGGEDARISGTASLAARYRGDVTTLAGGTGELDLERLEGTAFDLPLKLRGPVHLVAGAGQASLQDLDLDLAGGRLTGSGGLDASGDQELQAGWRGPLEGLSPLLAETAEAGESAPTLVGEGELTLVVRGTPEAPRPEVALRIVGGGMNRDEEALVQSLGLTASLREGTLRVEALEAIARDFHLTLTGETGMGLLPASVPEPLRRSLGGEARARAHLTIDRTATAPAWPGGEPLLVEADLETDALRYERLRAKVTVTGLAVEVQDVPLRPDRDFTLELADGLLTIPTVSWHGGDNDLRLGGTVRLPTGSGPLSAALLDLEAQGAIDLRLLAALGRGVEAGGIAHVETQVKGSLGVPDIDGSLRLEAAVFRYRPWRISLDDVTARVQAATSRLVLETLSGTLNGGILEGKGELALAGAKASGGQVTLSLTGAAIDWPKGFRGFLDGSLELRGGTGGPILSGSLTLANAAYKGDPRTLVPVAQPSLRSARSGSSSLLAGLGLDVRFQTDHEVRVDTPFGAFPFSLDLHATGTGAAPRLQGQVALGAGGYIYWSGRRFTLERGALTWSPVGGLVPFVDSRASTRVSSYTVTAQFTGPLTSADAGLSSNPPLSESEIASLLTTGNTGSGARDPRALGIVSANFLGNLGKVAGLDSVRIESADETNLLNFDPTRVSSETNPAQRLTITKRLSANLEATVSLNLSESGKTTTFVGWKPIPAVEVRVSQRDDYTGSLELRHDVSFGGGGREETPRTEVEAARHGGGRETVRSVEIEDDGGASRRRLRGRLKLKPGKTFRYEDWQKDRERVEAAVARGGYAEAYVIARREPRVAPPEGGEVALTYLIRRGSRTRVELRGGLAAPAVPDSVRRGIASAWSSGDFDSSIEEEALSRLRAHLARSGHFTPHLAADIETARDGKFRTLVITGDPGEKAKRRRVVFLGSALVPAEKLEALVKGRALEEQAFGDPARLEAAVTALYLEEGFLAAAAHARPAGVEGDEAVLKVEVEEGPLFHLGTLDVLGCVQVECAVATTTLGLVAGAPYREGEVNAARGRLVSFYRKRGFNGAQVRLDGEIQPRTALVDVHLRIEEGAQQVIREVVIAGADPATRRGLDHAITLAPGQPVVLEDWAAIRKKVYGTGLVRGVTLEPEVLPKEDGAEGADASAATPATAAPATPTTPAVEPVRARVEYDRWPALRVRYGLQLVTEKPLSEGGDNAVDLGATAELTRAIFLGHAVSTALSGEVRPDIWNARGVLSSPRTFGRTVRSSLYLIREHQKTEVDVPTLGITIPAVADSWEATLEERWRRGKLETALSYDIQWLTLGFPGTDFSDVRFRPARLVATVLLDGRNNILDPRKGYFSSVSGDYGSKALGSEFNFSRLFTQQYAYVPAPGNLVAATGFRFERASGGGQSFLTTERLGFGGPTTIRGYERDRVDLFNLFSAVGATTDVLILNQELRFPIWAELRGVAFVDFGRLTAHLDGTSGTDTRLGAGLGLRYSTPVGVLRVDFGFPLRGPEKKGLLYFGLGQAF